MNAVKKKGLDFQQIAEDFRYATGNPGTWPLIPKLTLLVGIWIFVVLAGGYFAMSGKYDELVAAQAQVETLKQDFADKKSKAVNLEPYRQQRDEVERSFGALLKLLPNSAEVEALLVEVNQAGLGRGLMFDLFRPGQEIQREFYMEVPIAVQLDGVYHDLGNFAADIGKLGRIVTLNDLKIAPSAKGQGRLNLVMEVRTFRYLTEQEQAAQKGGRK
ncbi:MAG: type 4a pilus biogenesis protein PilO [Zoogloeaceae bacterium]|jgi:type IV pilus assembly protein PilO|nr:type 4a pilus biogenesis protein PilO [Zoogloeaceae bacterium]